MLAVTTVISTVDVVVISALILQKRKLKLPDLNTH